MDEGLSFFSGQETWSALLSDLSKQTHDLAETKTLSLKTSVYYPAASTLWGNLISKGPMLTRNIKT